MAPSAFVRSAVAIAASIMTLADGLYFVESRTGVIDILRLMGAKIEILNERTVGGEPIALVRHRVLGGVEQGMCRQYMQQSLHHLALSFGALHVLRLFG